MSKNLTIPILLFFLTLFFQTNIINAQCTNDGGELTTSNGATEIFTCAGDGQSDAFDIILNNTSGSNSAWIITNMDGRILSLPFGPPFDLEGAGEGVCLLWHLSFEDGVQGIVKGKNANDLIGCHDLSNPITINRTGVDGGKLTTADGQRILEICAGDGNSDAFDVSLSGNQGTNSAWVITAPNGKILGLPAGPPFDLEGAGEGTCYIWHLSFEDGLSGTEIGLNANDLEGCFDLSNPIIVKRTGIEGGELTTADGETEITICAGDGLNDAFDISLTGNKGSNSAWVITDTDANILGLPAAPPFDLEGAGEGTCLIWHLSFEDGLTGAEVGNNAADLAGCFDLSNPITVNRLGIAGGELTTMDGASEVTICAGDGLSDAFDVNLSGNQGSNSAWVITDADANILALPAAPPFDLEGAGGGTCLIWHLSFEDGLTGAEVGNNAADLAGCFQLSNPVTVYRTGVNGGNLTTEDGQTELFICAGDGNSDAFNVNLEGAEGPNSAWIITNSDGKILNFPFKPPFDFELAGSGTCLLYHLSFVDGVQGIVKGKNINDLEGCHDLSNPITVNRNGSSGGELTFEDGSMETTVCVGNGTSPDLNVKVENASGSNLAWVITDTDGNILGLPAAPPFNFEAAGPGTCLIWHLSFEDGLQGVEVGLNANDLVGCFDLSNPITVNRIEIEGGMLTTTDSLTELTICAGDGLSDAFDVILTDNTGSKSAWVITDTLGNILGLPAAPPFDLEGAGQGVCLIWHLSFEDGLQGVEVGLNANDLIGCFDLSNPIVVNRIGVDGGMISTPAGIQRNRVVVANRASGTISVIDSDTDAVIGTYPMPDEGQPMYVVHNAMNNTVLVGDYNGQIVAFNGKDFSVTGTAAAGAGVFHMWISPDFGQLWVNNELDKTISVIDPTSLTTLATIPIPADLAETGFKPHDVIVMPNNSAAFVTMLNSSAEENYVVKYDAATFQETARVAVGVDPHVSLTGANGLLYVASQGSDQLSIHNRSDLSLVATLDIPNAHGLGMNADGTFLYIGNISDGGTNAHYTLDLATNTLVGDPVDAPFPVPHNYAVTSDNGKLFVTHSGGTANQVSVYELGSTPTLTTTLTAENNPFGLVAYSFTDVELTICAGDGMSDAFDVVLTGNTGSNSTWVITDTLGNILGLPAAPPFDLEGAGQGVCLIWHLSFEDGLQGVEVGLNANDLVGCFDLSNPITVNRTGVDGGMLMTTDSLTQLTICAGDGMSDAFDVVLTDNTGSNSAWVITDTLGNILGLPAAPPFDLEGAGQGVCLIWHLSFEDGLQGVEVGLNANDLVGCFDLSNPITVNRTGVDGGMLMTTDSLTQLTICAGDGLSDAFDVILTDNTGSNSAWVITDTLGNILGLPAAPPFDLEGAGQGVCLIWHLSFEDGLQGVEVGLNANDLVGCFDLSNPITVIRTGVDGGMLMTTDSLTQLTICAGDGMSDAFDVVLTGNTGSNSAWVITDTLGNILGLPAAPPFDLEGAGQGVCLIWHLSFEDGLQGVEVGLNANDLSGCFDLSNSIEVVRDTSGAACSTPLISLQPKFDPGFVKLLPYPNPASNQIRIDVELNSPAQNLQLEVYNLFGRKIYQQDLGDQEGFFSQELNIQNWPAGSYLIHLRTDEWIKPYRFVKR